LIREVAVDIEAVVEDRLGVAAGAVGTIGEAALEEFFALIRQRCDRTREFQARGGLFVVPAFVKVWIEPDRFPG
jgi:hypothetical protein